MEPRAAIAQALADSVRALIVGHVAPDGDCLGAGLALGAALRRLGKTAVVACADGVPASLRFLPGAGAVATAVADDEAFDVAVTLECATLPRAGALAGAVRRARLVAAIDHHPDHVPYADLTDVDPRAPAVGAMVADLIRRLGVSLDRAMALNLLTAVVTDTGAFRYANATPGALRLAADLMAYGASVHEVVRAVYEEQPVQAVRLLGTALTGVALHHNGRVATAVLTPAALAATGASWEDTSGIAAALRGIAGVRLAMVFEEREDRIRVSLRSRDGARADRVARALGGGGHPEAAGAEPAGGLEEVVALALDLAAAEVGVVDDEQPAPV
ncbi:MAG: bifunctional oligoribonuclease/PAP phosphatase NrnA [Armatimonadota bacterium]|nr:bifunctional oligoribonuclease/PAP phosphatase NrnA [Armatimonadota bacterium]MDR7421729.1 bifunctional oligoribonuclease/PAP phosphatase NrnA [Armatimonadota bacterium]MDR7497803.1 bifunctional oligoribonuclease/PAP phosphatase NrnA [Armatimonadota bacterium]